MNEIDEKQDQTKATNAIITLTMNDNTFSRYSFKIAAIITGNKQ